MDKYKFVADEMGNPGMSPVTSNTFVFGGYVVLDRDIDKAIDAWTKIRSELCGHADVELKWKHFFVDETDPRFSIPLKVKSKVGRRQLAALALRYLFHQAPLYPLIAIARKDRASKEFIVKSRKGGEKIDYDTMWVGPIGMFAVFLALKGARGKLCFDKLNAKQEKERQEFWADHLRQTRSGELPDKILVNFRKSLAIDEKIDFLDSKENEIIQIAEFVAGVIWNAGEGDEGFLAEFEKEYGKKAEKVGLGILHIT